MGSVRGAGRRSTSTEQQRQNPSGRNPSFLCNCKMCFDIGIATCGPNEALVISGMFQGGKPTFISGGRAIVCPCIQTVQRIPLNTMTLEVHSPRVYTSQGVPISVVGTAQVKINGPMKRCWLLLLNSLEESLWTRFYKFAWKRWKATRG